MHWDLELKFWISPRKKMRKEPWKELFLRSRLIFVQRYTHRVLEFKFWMSLRGEKRSVKRILFTTYLLFVCESSSRVDIWNVPAKKNKRGKKNNTGKKSILRNTFNSWAKTCMHWILKLTFRVLLLSHTHTHTHTCCLDVVIIKTTWYNINTFCSSDHHNMIQH